MRNMPKLSLGLAQFHFGIFEVFHFKVNIPKGLEAQICQSKPLGYVVLIFGIFMLFLFNVYMPKGLEV